MRNIFTLILLGIFMTINAQETSVEKSTFGIQAGPWGIWAHHEARITNSIALRSEIGMDYSFWGGSFVENGHLWTSVFNVEPRFYYNLKKRQSKNRKIIKNTGNFLSLRTSYHPDLFTTSNIDGIYVIPDLSFIPSWGIRRHIGKHISFEVGFGYRIQTYFTKSMGYRRNVNDNQLDFHLRLGYSF